MSNIPKIQLGDYIIIQRQKYTKLHKFGTLESKAMLGKERFELAGIEGHPYYSIFKMVPQEGKGSMRALQYCDESEVQNNWELLRGTESGKDNRNLVDDCESQSLGPSDISKLREEYTDSSKIIQKIVENSKTFGKKTEYSQEKYVKKKEKKYFEFVQIRRPTVRLLAEIYYRRPEKILHIRMDALSQILTYSGVCAFGNYLLYEAGTNGLLPAAMINAIGANTEGRLVHMHPKFTIDKQAILALNLPEEQSTRCISVNVESVFKEFHRNNTETSVSQVVNTRQSFCSKDIPDEIPNKKPRLDDGNAELPPKTPKWQIDNQRACEIMKEKFDGLVIAAKEHPVNIVKTLLPFVKASRAIVIFSQYQEILTELYVEMKSTMKVTNLHLVTNWMRMYQVLPNRTHPEMVMSGNNGYILYGYTVQ